MKIKLIGLLCVLVVVVLAPTFVQAQFDLGAPDTMIIQTNRPDTGVNDTSFIVELWVFNDGNGISPQFGFHWDSDVLTLDSAIVVPSIASLYSQIFLFESNNIGTSNTNKRASCSFISFLGNTIPASASRKLLVTYYYTISSWTALSEITVDSNSWDDGSELIFINEEFDDYIPEYSWGTAIVIKDPSDANDPNSLPEVYSLGQNYPNPFNPETTVDFSLEKAGEYSFTVYNVIGQVVFETTRLGTVGDNQIVWNGTRQASGVYFYKLVSGDYSETKKMMLLK